MGWVGEYVVAACRKLSLALARVLSIAARGHAKSLHALWPIRALTLLPAPIRTRQSSCANQDARAVVTTNRPKANSMTFRRVTLTHARLPQNHVKGCIFNNTSLRPHYLSLAIVPFAFGINHESLQYHWWSPPHTNCQNGCLATSG